MNFVDLPLSALVQALNFTPPLVFECAFLASTAGAFQAAPERISALRQQAAEGAPIDTAIALTHDERVVAANLVEERYASRGFQREDSTDAYHVDDDCRAGYYTVLAYSGHEPVGTVTLGFDGVEGLYAEEGNVSTIAQLRKRGARLCELVRLALAENADSRRTLAALFNATYGLVRAHEASDLVIEVNPRHALFYRRALGFEVIGEERICPRVSAPSVLLRLEIEALSRRIENLRAVLADMPLE